MTERFPDDSYAFDAAAVIAGALPERGSVVLTGGTTAEKIYPALAEATPGRWAQLEVFFSDERCVRPDDSRSNYGMARRLLLDPVGAERVVRMKGEIDPEIAASSYHEAAAAAVESGFDLVLLGMGADCHICALFPGSPALGVTSRLCVAVDRPDGLRGLTLTPPAVLSAQRIFVIVTGESKAEAVRRVVAGSESVKECPARLLAPLADQGRVTFLLDTSAAASV